MAEDHFGDPMVGRAGDAEAKVDFPLRRQVEVGLQPIANKSFMC